MRLNFRQGVVSYQSGGFLQVSGNVVNILAGSRPVTITLAHKDVNYSHSEDNSVNNAWVGPFIDSNYWLYWDFDPLTFVRTFNYTTIEPIAQSIEPGTGDASVVGVTPGAAGVGSFVVNGFYNLPVGKLFAIVNSTANNGNYTVSSIVYNNSFGQTTIYVTEEIVSGVVDGKATLDIDSFGNPLYIEGRHWFNTATNIHSVLVGNIWKPVIRVFAARLLNGNTLISLSQNSQLGDFTGTQIGSNYSVFSGRVLVDNTAAPIRKADGTFFTTESEFFTNQSRVDSLRLESNTTTAQSIASTLSKFSVVAWKSDGRVDIAQYDDVGNTVVGVLTEDISYLEVGSIIVQGSVTNVLWNWTNTVAVGTTLWVENGQLVSIDPNISNPVTYPTQHVPVARVLSKDTIIFEQGLGGIGPRGPEGTAASLPPADTTNLGVVTLLTPSSNTTRAFVISDTDARLTNARLPLAHTHTSSQVTFLTGGGVISNNVQSAIVELGTGKVNISGGVMTGLLTLSAEPIAQNHATTKKYVDNLVNGLVWLEPIDGVNIISDSVSSPPGSPKHGDSYIMPNNLGTGSWAGSAAGDVEQWDNDALLWTNLGPIQNIHTGDIRVGIAMQTNTVPSGNFAGNKNNIALFDTNGNFTGFEIPINNSAVYVDSDASLFAFDQYAFDGTKWVRFGGSNQAFVGDGLTISVSGGVISTIPTSNSGQVDAITLSGNNLNALDLRWAALGHTHASNQITFVPYTGDSNWGTPNNTFSGQLSAVAAQSAIQQLADTKAEKTPAYSALGNLPSAVSEKGMLTAVLNSTDDTVYFSDGAAWVPLAKRNHAHNNPYDIKFFITGALSPSKKLGIFAVPRTISVALSAPTSIAIATVPPSVSPTTFLIFRDIAPTYNSPVLIGSILFSVGNNIGTITWNNNITFVPSDRIIIATDAAPTDVDEISITIVACEAVVECTTI